MKEGELVKILMADDDEDDCLLAREALAANRFLNELYFVHDGEEVLNYLYNRGQYADKAKYPMPNIILLDLNMPKKDGREVLLALKSDPKLRSIPVVVLTTSKAEEDILRSYDLGANTYVTKPVTFEGLVEAVKTIGRYWFELVELPNR